MEKEWFDLARDILAGVGLTVTAIVLALVKGIWNMKSNFVILQTEVKNLIKRQDELKQDIDKMRSEIPTIIERSRN